MNSMSLHDFVARVLADDRILFADLKRLQRDILPERITSREEAEILLFLDSVIHRADREWTAYLTATIRDFAVWKLEPAGSLDRSKAEWIAAALACADPGKTARAILREIVHEARSIDDDALLELGMGGQGMGDREAVRGRRARKAEVPLCASASWPRPTVGIGAPAAHE
jgi:hypothetical protein